MSLSRDSKAERKAKFHMRSVFRYEQGMARIEWEENVLIPAIEALKAGKAVPILGLESGNTFDIEVVNEDPPPSKATRKRGAGKRIRTRR